MSDLVQVEALFPMVIPKYNPEQYKKDRTTKERLQWGPFEAKRTLEEDEKSLSGKNK